MSYAIPADMLERFRIDELSQLVTVPADLLRLAIAGEALPFGTDPDLAAEAAAAVVEIDKAIATAAERIDAHVAARWEPPYGETQARVLKGIACDIARWRLYPGVAPDSVKEAKEDAMKLLVSIRDGKAVLGVATEDQPPGTSGVKIGRSTRRSLSDGTLDDFSRDRGRARSHGERGNY